MLIGDGSHGTPESYTAGAEIIKYVIQNHGFNVAAVKADWVDAEAIDRHVRNRPRSRPSDQGGIEPVGEVRQADRKPALMRFPTWMQRSMEVHSAVEWLREWNEPIDAHHAVGFCSLDLSSLGVSIRAILEHVDNIDKMMADVARERYGDLMMYPDEPREYGLQALDWEFDGHKKGVVSMLRNLLSKRLK